MWEKLERMDDEKKNTQYYTFMAIPHSNGKVFRLRIPHTFLKVAAALTVISLTLVVFLTGSYFEAKKDAAELEELRVTNGQLEEKVENLNERAATLRERMAGLQEMEKNIRTTLDLGDADKNEEIVVASHQVTRGLAQGRNDTRILPNEKGQESPASVLGFSVIQQEACQKACVDVLDVEQLTCVLEEEMDDLAEKINTLNVDVNEWKAYMNAKPSIWPVGGKITSNFGYRKSPYYGFHEGVDIGAGYGAAFCASGAGVVEFAAYDGGYGYCIVINHGHGFKTKYAHNSSINVRVGDRVQKGQKIGNVGNSGFSTGPHLHYEVHCNGQPVDPLQYMQ